MGEKWDRAVERYHSYGTRKHDLQNKYFRWWEENKDIVQSESDEDADALIRIMDEYDDVHPKFLLDSAADEYDEAMKAEAIMEGMK